MEEKSNMDETCAFHVVWKCILNVEFSTQISTYLICALDDVVTSSSLTRYDFFPIKWGVGIFDQPLPKESRFWRGSRLDSCCSFCQVEIDNK